MLKIVGCCKIVIIIKYPAWIYDFQDIQQKTIQDGIKQGFTIQITNELEPNFEEELYRLTLRIHRFWLQKYIQTVYNQRQH